MKTQLNQTKNRLFLILALAGLLFIAAACTTPAATTTETNTTAVTESIAAAAAETAVAHTDPLEPAVAAETTNQPAAVDAPEAVVETVANEPETTADSVVAGLAAAVGSLSDNEIADLLFMREEEKLAHDVYIALYNVWGTNLFLNIAASEQTHTDSVLALLNSYGLTDPVGDNAPGVFVNADLQALYDQLVASGSQSLADALRVGAAIEEIDILDLDKAIAETGPADIVQVYQSLRAGSENHLRAFVSTLERQTGETYQPQYLSPEAYAAIISGTQSQGNGNGGNGRGGNGNGNGRGGNNG